MIRDKYKRLYKFKLGGLIGSVTRQEITRSIEYSTCVFCGSDQNCITMRTTAAEKEYFEVDGYNWCNQCIEEARSVLVDSRLGAGEDENDEYLSKYSVLVGDYRVVVKLNSEQLFFYEITVKDHAYAGSIVRSDDPDRGGIILFESPNLAMFRGIAEATELLTKAE